MGIEHKTRAHSKFSASGATRWFNCPGSVALSEGLPDKPNAWSLEGTQAHEVLESVLKTALRPQKAVQVRDHAVTPEMLRHAQTAAKFIVRTRDRHPGSEALVETRVYLDFIHPEMFGTFDGAVIEHFGTLHVFDYKYGKSMVSPKENLQMIFYGIGLAHLHQWNFNRVRLWIIQPRVHGYDGPTFWDLSVTELRSYVAEFKRAVDIVERKPKRYIEGDWCHWCRAKSICPLKQENKLEKAIEIFSVKRKETPSGKQEKSSHQKSEADWRKEAQARKKGGQKSKGR